jgi:hypothetical protein
MSADEKKKQAKNIKTLQTIQSEVESTNRIALSVIA